MGTSTSSLGPQKWMNARSDGVNQMKQQQLANDFPSLPTSASGKQGAYNKNSLVRGTISVSRSNGNLATSETSSKNVFSGSGSAKVTKSSGQSDQDDSDWNTTGYPGNYSYEYDLATAISASLADSAASRSITSSSRTGSAPQLNKLAQAQTLEEAFPALGMGLSTSSTTANQQPQQKKPQTQRPKLSNDLADAMKMIGTDPNKKKKKASSGLTVVKTLKPKTADDTATSSPVMSPVPPADRVTPPPPPSTGTVGIGAGPSWGRAFGGFGNNPK
jgi:hypothetical protein